MVRECEHADAHPPPEGLDPRVGWELVQHDWGVRQREPNAPSGPRSCPIARILAAPIAAVHALLRGRVRC